MQQQLFHGILVDMGFIDPLYPKTFSIFAQEKSGDWTLYGIEVPRKDLGTAIKNIQTHLRQDQPFYAHLYNDEEMIVLFKEQVFHVTSHISSWVELLQYGKELNIPEEQLDFWPNRFQDERHYFKSESFVSKSK